MLMLLIKNIYIMNNKNYLVLITKGLCFLLSVNYYKIYLFLEKAKMIRV